MTPERLRQLLKDRGFDLHGVHGAPRSMFGGCAHVLIDGVHYCSFVNAYAAKEAVKLWKEHWHAMKGRLFTVEQ